MVLCEVSNGELFDKLSILEIKLEMIKDTEKLIDIKKEYDIVDKSVSDIINKVSFYYEILKIINKEIWISMDKLRELDKNSEEWKNVCHQTIVDNDRRFRVKKKINNLSNSNLKEQKGYKPKTAFVLTHLGLGDNITAIGAVRYLSTCYDKVIVVCKEKNKRNMELFYGDDETIELYPVIEDINISPNCGCSPVIFKNITKGMDLYIAGLHTLTKTRNHFKDLPFNFYRDMGIDEKYFWEYFHVNIPPESKILFEKLKNIKKYIFIHNSSSSGEVFSVKDIEQRLNFNRKKILIINPNKNIYDVDDPFFELANKFLNSPLSFYTETIVNASKVIMTDSSFFCVALNFKIKTSKCYLKSRNNVNYSHIIKNTNFTQI